MTAEQATDGLTQRLLEARRAGDYSPAWLAGAIDLGQALDLQLAVLDDELANGRALGGWKVGLTSERARTTLGVDERPFGFIPADRVLESGWRVAAGDIAKPSVEAEMCFTVGSAITDPDITPDRILDHMSAVSAGFEINERRPGSVPQDFPAMVTDCLTNWAIAAGQEVTEALTAERLNATNIVMACDGHDLFNGISSDHCDDHAVSLCHLVAKLADHGQSLQPGQRIITGAFARFPVEPGQHWQATFTFTDGSSGGSVRRSTVELTFD